jgi:hypothetical protein
MDCGSEVHDLLSYGKRTLTSWNEIDSSSLLLERRRSGNAKPAAFRYSPNR